MKSKFRIIALLLAVVMMFTSCEFINNLLGNVEATTYTVTFETDGGSSVSSQEVESGQFASLPDDPTKSGYLFDGWYVDEQFATKWDYSSAVTSDITVHAKWNKAYTVSFNTNGGSEVAAQCVAEGTRASMPSVKKTGYKLIGWYTDAELTNPHKFVKPITEDTVLYAKWKEVPELQTYTLERTDISTSVEEMKAKYTLDQDKVTSILNELDALVELSKNASDISELEVLYAEFEVDFYYLAQQMTVASIVYYYDMADEEAEENYLSTTDSFYDVQDKYMISCRTIYLESPFSDEFFEGWSEEEINDLLEYDPEISEVKKEIDALQVEYNNLDDTDAYYSDNVVAIYVKLVTANNKLAKLCGFDNYYEYASKNVYGRDYSTEDLAIYRSYIKNVVSQYIPKLYNAYSKYSGRLGTSHSAYKTFMERDFDASKKQYLMNYLNSLSGSMGEGMRDVFESQNCIFTDAANSHPTAFQTWIYTDDIPFCLFGSSGQTNFTLAHEIGHYYAAYTNNEIDNYDLCETHSQGNEFLFLDFCSDYLATNVYNTVKAEQIWSSCITIVMSAMVDEFEQRVYELDSVEGMTTRDFDNIMSEVCNEYGAGATWMNDNLVTNAYSYWRLVAVDNPVYYVSYSVSGVAALTLYAEVEENEEVAYAAYTKLVEGVTSEDGFLGALEKANISNPFEEETYIMLEKFLDKATK